MRVGKGTVIFRAVYGTFTFLAILIVAILLVQLWRFLEVYEKSRPEVVAEAFVQELAKDKTILLGDTGEELNEFEDESVLTEYYAALTNGEISYSRNGRKSDSEKTVYNLIIDGEVIAELTVAQSDTELGYGMYEYEVSGISCREAARKSFNITAPSSADVYINGKIVSGKYTIQTSEPYKETVNFHGLISENLYDVTYKVDGFVNEPEIMVMDKAGNALVTENGKYILAQVNDNELSQTALGFSQAYSRYIVNDGKLSEAAAYLAPDMPIYSELYGFENTWHNWHSGYDFLDVQADSAVLYTPDCAAVRVRYDHVLYGVSNTESGELHSPADYTVYLVKIEGQWKVTELKFN